MVNLEKSHDTGLRIIEVLKILLEENVDKNTIIKRIKSNNDIASAYTHEAYLKYFNTFEALGLKIIKTETGFCLKNALISIDLTQNEINMLFKVIDNIPKLNNTNDENKLKNFILRLDKYLNADLETKLNEIENSPVSDSMKSNILNTLRQSLEDKSLVKITFKRTNGKEETFDVAIKKIIEENAHYYAMCYNPTMIRSRRISLDSITDIKRSPKQVIMPETSNTVIFEVYGRLAKSYKLKPWEALDDYGANYTRIINKKEALETLLLRLLKYGENCKIIKPADLIDNFISLTNDILSNLGENACQK